MADITFQQEQEERIAFRLKQMKFRRRVFGGVSEIDVWKKISELNDMYKEALLAERARYDALLEKQAAGTTGTYEAEQAQKTSATDPEIQQSAETRAEPAASTSLPPHTERTGRTLGAKTPRHRKKGR